VQRYPRIALRGLIRTSRAGKAVQHTITPLGRELLNADGDQPGRG
jgi:hypothetical protein